MVSNILIMKTDKNIIWVIALHVITFTFVIISWNHSFNNIGFNIASGLSCMLLGSSYLYLESSKYSEKGKVTCFSITHTIIPLIFLLFWTGIALIFYHYIALIPQHKFLQELQVSEKQSSQNTWICQKFHLS